MRVLLVFFDTMRHDRAGFSGYGKGTTPNLDSLAGKGSVFTNVYATDVPTQPCYTATLTGKRGVTTGVVSHGQPEETIPTSTVTLPKILAQHGILTAGISTLCRFRRWFADGFTHYLQPDMRTWLQHVTAKQVNEQALPWLRAYATRGDFFLFLHYWDPHTPYSDECREFVPRFYTGNPKDPENHSLDGLRRHPMLNDFISGAIPDLEAGVTDINYVNALYDAEIYYADKHFGEIVATLDDLGVLDDTMIVFTSDHGESMWGEHGIYFDHMDAYEQVSHVPLVAWHSERVRTARLDALVQHIDLAPTILEAFGLEAPPDYEGRSLWPLLQGKEEDHYEAVVTNHGLWSSQRAMRTKEWSLVKTIDSGMLDPALAPDPKPRTELFQRGTDPAELHDVAAEQGTPLAEMELRYHRWLEEHLGTRPDPLRMAAAAAQAAKKELRALHEKKGTSGARTVASPGTRAKIDDNPTG